METITILLFCGALLLCVVTGYSILYALAAGLVLFCLYARKQGRAWREILTMCLTGVKTVKNVLITFGLIGFLTALWRACGTIAVIVCWASELIWPPLFLLLAFLLNCGMSLLTGTAFGTAATMGVICAAIGSALGVSPVLLGGAVLSGVYFGDRCSPLSTSALLVTELTGTDIYDNIHAMFRSALVPLVLSCGVYLLLGLTAQVGGTVPDLRGIFSRELDLHWAAVLPAAAILLLSFRKWNVKKTMLVSILLALPITVFLQGTSISSLPALLLTGYHAADPETAALLDGGGLFSMVKVAGIVSLSSAYAGIFRSTGLLDGLKAGISRFARRTTPYFATLAASFLVGMVACNQTLTIMLTHQLCGELIPDDGCRALTLADTAIVTAPLIPWSISAAVPLASIASPSASILFACFLYLLPLWNVVSAALRRRKERFYEAH